MIDVKTILTIVPINHPDNQRSASEEIIFTHPEMKLETYQIKQMVTGRNRGGYLRVRADEYDETIGGRCQ